MNFLGQGFWKVTHHMTHTGDLQTCRQIDASKIKLGGAQTPACGRFWTHDLGDLDRPNLRMYVDTENEVAMSSHSRDSLSWKKYNNSQGPNHGQLSPTSNHF